MAIIVRLDRMMADRKMSLNELAERVIDPDMKDEIVITVIATEFEKEKNMPNMNVDSLVSKAWDKKVSSIPTSSDNSSNSNDLDIPSFLRKKQK